MTLPGLRQGVLAALLGGAAFRGGFAQGEGPVTLRGAVVAAESGERLAYALVALEPGAARRFASEDGAFVFPGLAPASYRLIVRQVGFRPFDSTVAVGSATPALRIELQRITVELRAIRVAADSRCTAPGAPDPAVHGELATIFEQLKLNAQRHALLLDQYPFRYTIERELADERRDGASESTYDTLVYRSNARRQYRPGYVVTDDPDDRGSARRVVHFPILADLADSAFHATHCFQLAGIDSLEDAGWLRMDFRAAQSLRTPDVEGAAYLDPRTYQVRHTTFVVTRVDRAAPGVTAFSATATFRELLPNLIVIERVRTSTGLSVASRGGNPVVGRSERQRLLRVEFLGAAAGGREGVP